jgi:hypothetical protein
MNGVVNSNMYFTKKIEVRAMVIVERLLLPSFTYVNILTFNPCGLTSFTCKAMSSLSVYIISKKPMVT